MRIVRIPTTQLTNTGSQMIWLNGVTAWQRALGGLVPARGGYWINYMQASASDTTKYLIYAGNQLYERIETETEIETSLTLKLKHLNGSSQASTT